MRKRERELLWELPLALIAAAGVLAVIEGISRLIILIVFGIALTVMLVTWILRFIDAAYPIKIVSAIIDINTADAEELLEQKKEGILKESVVTTDEGEMHFVKGEKIADPIIELQVAFYSSDAVRISRDVILKLPKVIEGELKSIGKLYTNFELITDGDNETIDLQEGGYIKAHAEMPLRLKTEFTDEINSRLNKVASELKGKCEIEWQEIGHKKSHYKLRGKYEL